MRSAAASPGLPASISTDTAPVKAWAGTVVMMPTGTTDVNTSRSQPHLLEVRLGELAIAAGTAWDGRQESPFLVQSDCIRMGADRSRKVRRPQVSPWLHAGMTGGQIILALRAARD
jgi:hypothetical protein